MASITLVKLPKNPVGKMGEEWLSILRVLALGLAPGGLFSFLCAHDPVRVLGVVFGREEVRLLDSVRLLFVCCPFNVGWLFVE
jgi:hypothetical protein